MKDFPFFLTYDIAKESAHTEDSSCSDGHSEIFYLPFLGLERIKEDATSRT